MNAPNGLDLLAAVAVIVTVAVVCWHVRWAAWDRQRRQARLRHRNVSRNLARIGGPR